MKLAICTDVFADLSYTDMLDKVKSLGIDAVETMGLADVKMDG